MSNSSDNNALYRLPQQGVIAGVCAGIAVRFKVETWLVRVVVMSAFVLGAMGLVLLLYIAAWLILDKKEFISLGDDRLDQSAYVKSRVWQQGKPPQEAFNELKKQYRDIELRLRNLETFVTSKSFDLSRKIDDL